MCAAVVLKLMVLLPLRMAAIAGAMLRIDEKKEPVTLFLRQAEFSVLMFLGYTVYSHFGLDLRYFFGFLVVGFSPCIMQEVRRIQQELHDLAHALVAEEAYDDDV